MKLLLKPLVLVASLLFTISAFAEEAKPAEWLFVHTSTTAEMTSDTTLVMPVTREIFAFTDRPNRKHGYLTAHAFVSLWDKGEGNTFKADPPNAVLTWLDGDKVHEAEVVITDASVLAHGRAISFEVKLEAGQALIGQMQGFSMFIDAIPRLCGPKTTKLMLHYCAKCMGDTCG
jgi:hypothetical protein